MPQTDDVPLPYYVMMEIEELLGCLPDKLATLFWPSPWPRHQMMAMTRLVATETGIPELCDDAHCRRGGSCRAQTIGANGPPCAQFWSDAALNRLEGGFDGLVLAWMHAERTNSAIRDGLPAPFETVKPQRKAKGKRPKQPRKR